MFKTIFISNIRRFSSFKRPPPSYMFKRPVVPSDFEYPEWLLDKKNEEEKNIYDCENEKWTTSNDNFKKNSNDDNIQKK